MRQHQRDGLRMFAVEQFAQLRRIGALQLGQIAVRLFLRMPQLHQQLVGALFPERVDQQTAGIIQPAMHHEVLRLEQFPELLDNFGRQLRRDAAQIGQFLGQPLHVRFRQCAQDLLGEVFSHRDQQDGGLANAVQLRRFALPRLVVLDFRLCHGSLSLSRFRGSLPLPAFHRALAADCVRGRDRRVIRSESSSATGANSAPARASDVPRLLPESAAPASAADRAAGASGGFRARRGCRRQFLGRSRGGWLHRSCHARPAPGGRRRQSPPKCPPAGRHISPAAATSRRHRAPGPLATPAARRGSRQKPDPGP